MYVVCLLSEKMENIILYLLKFELIFLKLPLIILYFEGTQHIEFQVYFSSSKRKNSV